MVESTNEKDFPDLWKEEQQRVWTASAVSRALRWTERARGSKCAFHQKERNEERR